MVAPSGKQQVTVQALVDHWVARTKQWWQKYVDWRTASDR